MLQRNNPGVEEVSIGGATMVALQFRDQDGIYNFEDYYKWADDTDGDAFIGLTVPLAIALSLLSAIF